MSEGRREGPPDWSQFDPHEAEREARRAERDARRDPRPSIEERHAGRGDYLAKVRAVTDALVRDRYMLAEDIDTAVSRAAEHWELLAGTTTTSAGVR